MTIQDLFALGFKGCTLEESKKGVGERQLGVRGELGELTLEDTLQGLHHSENNFNQLDQCVRMEWGLIIIRNVRWLNRSFPMVAQFATRLFAISNDPVCMLGDQIGDCNSFWSVLFQDLRIINHTIIIMPSVIIPTVHTTMVSLLLLLLFQMSSAIITQTINQTISIQTINQTYFSYLPLSNCSYQPAKPIQDGRVEYTALDPLTIFQSIQVADQVVFWGAMADGPRMLVNQGELLQNGTYSQVVLYNSSLQANLTQRQLILVTFTTDFQIVFTYALPAYNYSTNSLTPDLVEQQSFELGLDVEIIVRECNQNGNYVRIVYVGNDTFMGVCPNTTKLFAWTATNTSTTTQTYVYSNSDLSFLAGDNIQNLTNNPTVLFPGIQNISLPPTAKQYYWNLVLLTQGGSSAFFCSANLSGLLCQGYQNEENWLEIVIERGWGLQSAMEVSEIQLILAEFPGIVNYSFPGSVVSIFSYYTTIFVESNNNGTFFLAIFQNEKILANVSLIGQIIYYGRENLIIEQDNNFWIVDFLLPIYEIIYPLEDHHNYTNITVMCNSTEYILNYQIVWSNIAFPSFVIQQIDSTPQVSYQSVKIQNLNDYYLVIGPAFEIFIDLDEQIDINLLDISEMLGIDQFIDIVNIIFISATMRTMVPYEIIYLDIEGILKKYKLGSQQTLQMPSPCGLSNIRRSFPLQNGYVFSDFTQLCYCDQDISSCQLVSQAQLPSLISQNTQSLGEYSFSLSQIMQSLSSTPTPTPTPTSFQNGNAIKKQLLTVVNDDLIINIYQNNTVTLTNFQGDVIDIIAGICLDFNSTDGTIFTRNFYDDFLILYCYNSPTITQYLLRNEVFLFNRLIPIYGFLTTSNSNAILSGQNYIFLQVDLNPEFFGDIKYKTDTTTCCILRVDPDQFTVSVIAEVIPANKLITVYSIFGVDVVFYNETQVSSQIPFIKVYFDSSWIAFSQSTVCTPQNCSSTPNTYTYNLSLISNIYNFAAAYNQNITFNVSASFISFTGSGVQDIQMTKHIGDYVSFNSSVNYNFNNFCGPIASFSEANQVRQLGGIFSILQNGIITPNKELTNNYEPILQVMDIADYAKDNSLTQCVLVVGLQNLTFYLKYDGKWMDTLAIIQSTQLNCLYFVSSIVNQTAIQFGSNCYNFITNNPYLIVNYNSTSKQFNYSIGSISLPMQMRSIVSLIQNNQTFLLGIQQGPSKSISGVFYLCNLTLCNSLTINSKIVFFIDFDQQLSSQGLLVVGLDVYNLSFWLDPTAYPLGGINVPADYVVNYQSYIGSSCSKVKIVAASLTQPNILLSCGNFYKQIIINFSNPNNITITEVMTFDKFSNCQVIDRFKPQIILYPNTTSNIAFLAVQCQQSVNIVRLEEIYALNTNTSIEIVTGYLLIYTAAGPKCAHNRWSPIRMISLGTSQQLVSYLIYQANGQWKLLYEQINGILIDNFIEMQPNSYYQLIELTKEVVYPTILMTIENPYFELGLSIIASPQKNVLSQTFFYIVLGIFILFNVVTVVCFGCWCIFRKASLRQPRLRFFSDTNSNPLSIITDPSKTNNSKILSDKQSRFSSNYNYEKGEESVGIQHREQDLSVYSGSDNSSKRTLKRKGTEIELFQPR